MERTGGRDGDEASLEGRVAVVTGANSGVGLETARALAARGATVALAVRDLEKGARAAAEIAAGGATGPLHVVHLDLASFAATQRCADELLERFPRVHVLVNNAGLVLSQRTLTEDGLEATFQVNHLGHFLLTERLRDRLVESAPARVVNVSSEAHRWAFRGLDFDDLQSERRYGFMDAYAKSKLANVLFTRELARRLAGTGVTANSLHPGTIASGFARDGDTTGLFAKLVVLGAPWLTTPQKGADTQVWLATSPEVERVSGEYFVRRRVRRPSRAGRDDAAARRLWEASERLVAAATR